MELVRSQEGCFVFKSYHNCSPLIRNTVGRLAIGRECWALRRLEFSDHTPKLIAQTGPFSVKMEFIEGRPLEHLPKLDPKRLYSEAESLLGDLKKAGVIHSDLGHDHWQNMGRETNLIWTEDQRLKTFDFSGALPFASSSPLAKRLLHALRQHDQLLLTKMKYHFPSQDSDQVAPTTEWPIELWDLLRLLGKL